MGGCYVCYLKKSTVEGFNFISISLEYIIRGKVIVILTTFLAKNKIVSAQSTSK